MRLASSLLGPLLLAAAIVSAAPADGREVAAAKVGARTPAGETDVVAVERPGGKRKRANGSEMVYITIVDSQNIDQDQSWVALYYANGRCCSQHNEHPTDFSALEYADTTTFPFGSGVTFHLYFNTWYPGPYNFAGVADNGYTDFDCYQDAYHVVCDDGGSNKYNSLYYCY